MTKFSRLINAIIVVIIVASLSSCYNLEAKKYYSEKSNYITVSGKVSHISYNKEQTVLYIGFAEMSEEFDDNCFKIIEDNLKIGKNNGIDDVLCLGKRVEFVTAPRYFGDGYVMPIVALSIDGKCYLKFDDGYNNLMRWLN